MSEGDWIKLHRKIRKSAVYQDSKTVHLWIELLMRASWETGQLLNGVTLQPGELVCGQKELAKSINLSHREVRTRLDQLAKCGNVTIKTTSLGTHVTICNWRTYQLLPGGNDKANDKPTTSERQTNDKRATTVKKVQEEEEVKNVKKKSGKTCRFVPPTVEQVRSYSEGRETQINASEFVDYYEARGWHLNRGLPMKNWNAAVRTWEKNNFSGNGKPKQQYSNEVDF